MSELMRGIPFENIITWSLDEYKKMGSVFGIRKDKFYFNKSGKKQKIVLGCAIPKDYLCLNTLPLMLATRFWV